MCIVVLICFTNLSMWSNGSNFTFIFYLLLPASWVMLFHIVYIIVVFFHT